MRWGGAHKLLHLPLLVVSAYTGVLNPDGITYSGYVSGNIVTQGGEQPKYEHDFGSILAFIENNFSLGQIAPPYYADYNAIDWVFPNRTNNPLSDFFPIPASKPRTFVPISPTNSSYNANYFQNYYVNNNLAPMGPDGGDDD